MKKIEHTKKKIMGLLAVGMVLGILTTLLISDQVREAAAGSWTKFTRIRLENNEEVYNSADGEVGTDGVWCVDGEPLSKSLTFYVADTGATDKDPAAKWLWQNDVTVVRSDYYSQTEIGTNAVTAVIKSGTNTTTCTIDSGETFGSQTTDVSFTAADVCSLSLSDGAAGTGGIGYFVIQYTEKSD